MGKEEQVISADTVRREARGDVVILTIDNPPLATLTAEIRAKLVAELDAAEADDAVRAIVLAGAGDVFAAGASASEADEPDVPDLGALCDRVEACDKPVVAAIRGSALGGGLELALAAHLRVVHPASRLGSPEITVGLVPRAGGTQRLPKVVGGVAALKMLLSGRAVSGDSSAKLGLADILAAGDTLEAAVEAARKLADSAGSLRRSSTRRDRLGEGTAFLEAVAQHRKIAAKSPLEAPLRLIECVESALLLPYDIGRGLELAAYEDLVNSDHSRSLRHIFAAERQLQAATRWEGRVGSRPLKSVAVIGAQAEGAELAVLCLDAGFDVTVAEDSDEALETGVSRIIEHFDARVAASKMTEDGVEQILDRMHAVSGFSKLIDSDIVVDPFASASAERVKELDTSMREGSVLALGLEGSDPAEVAAGTGREADVVSMRFPTGLRQNRLVEFAVTDKTGPKAVATARALMRKLDRLILDVKPKPYSVASRLVAALHAAADLCLEDGGRVLQIDTALRDWGLPYGSFTFRDIVGLKRDNGNRGAEGARGSGLDAALIAAGRTGLAVGRGYFLYQQRGKMGVEDPEVTALIEADRAAKSISTRTLSDGEVRIRCVAAMAGAGAQMLSEGIVRRPADIDMVAVHALGFARRTGGVMYAADLLGLSEVRDVLVELSQESARIAPPDPIFQDLIRSEKTFDDLNS
ncbi:enoyl-CoA hydratase-related protein [Silicimonas sp. MF1-12-2]|uniref:enoyl-CoA hydratase-related protein n=1 Tax=Silicimonas sp. MF1-12-2 TaxID=3384793 RepID=UPI0039B5CD26